MTNYNFGEIVLIGFPQTDLGGISKRPELIIYDAKDEDIIVTRITAQEYNTKTDYKIINWDGAGLLVKSFIRLSKIATLKKDLIIRVLGKLPEDEVLQVKNILSQMFK